MEKFTDKKIFRVIKNGDNKILVILFVAIFVFLTITLIKVLPELGMEYDAEMIKGNLHIDYDRSTFADPDALVWIEGLPKERYSIGISEIIIYDYEKEDDIFFVHIGGNE